MNNDFLITCEAIHQRFVLMTCEGDHFGALQNCENFAYPSLQTDCPHKGPVVQTEVS